MQSELQLLDQLIFQPCGLTLSNIETEPESQEYFAHRFQLGKRKIVFRMAKVTPKKIGQFVTIWKRNEMGITQPLESSDDFDFCMVATRKEHQLGLFVFSKSILLEKGILSDKTKEGKRGIRVYPGWDTTINNQARKSQEWQTQYFLELSGDRIEDITRAKHLLR